MDDWGKSRYDFPGWVRPARPERWLDEATEHGVTVNTSMPVLGLYVLICDKPCNDQQIFMYGIHPWKTVIHLDMATIDHIYDAFYCHTRFGNVGRHDDLSCVPAGGFEDNLLILGRQTRM